MLKYENIRLKDENIKREADARQANVDFEQGKEAFVKIEEAREFLNSILGPHGPMATS
jgi:hypothetical protein